MNAPKSFTYDKKSEDGSTVQITWFEEGAHAVVRIMRPDKAGTTFRMSREEATALRSFLPDLRPDQIYNYCGSAPSEPSRGMP